MQPVETEGDSVDAAIAVALNQLGVTREQVSVEVVHEASRGFLGIGARPARVRVAACVAAPVVASTPSAESEAVEAKPHPPVAAPIDASLVVEPARTALQGIVDHFGVGAAVTARAEGDHVVLEIVTDDGVDVGGWLIGRKGQTLDALEYLVSRIVARDVQQPVHLVVDAQGYRGRRETALGEMAHRIAAQVRQSGRAVPLPPMSPRDRRYVHLVLQDDASVRTHSTGEGPQRRLVVAPAGRRR